jgi:hypothetical protein
VRATVDNVGMRRWQCVLVLAAVALGCGKEREPVVEYVVDGTWVGPGQGHLTEVFLLLRREGDRILGTACHTEYGHRIYRDVPVEGVYPSLSFYNVQARVESNRLIEGFFVLSTGSKSPTYFGRCTMERYDACRNAPP